MEDELTFSRESNMLTLQETLSVLHVNSVYPEIWLVVAHSDDGGNGTVPEDSGVSMYLIFGNCENLRENCSER